MFSEKIDEKNFSRYKSIFEHYKLAEKSLDEAKIQREKLKHRIVRWFQSAKAKSFAAQQINQSNKKTLKKKATMKNRKSPKPKNRENIGIQIPLTAEAKQRKTKYNPKMEKRVIPPKIDRESRLDRSERPKEKNLLMTQNASLSHSPKTLEQPISDREEETDLGDLISPENYQELIELSREIFRSSFLNFPLNQIRPNRIRLKCENNEQEIDQDVEKHSQCLNVYEDYVNALTKPFGIIRPAHTDLPMFEPGISILGPGVTKDPSTIDREDSMVIKKMMKREPRKKYGLVHENVGIFVIGGYNLHVDTQVQREPKNEYLFKENGSVIKIPPIKPCRVHFGIFTSGDKIYIAGGQTLNNELLGDIQCLNLKSLQWEHVADLKNPIAACGLAVDQNRIYVVGGYDISMNQVTFLAEYSIFNIETKQFEKSTDLPSPRCRSLLFTTKGGIICVSGLIDGRNQEGVGKITISRDILKWSQNSTKWTKISETPELTKTHSLSFNDPYLEVTNRLQDLQTGDIQTALEGYYHFRENKWYTGAPPMNKTPEEIEHGLVDSKYMDLERLPLKKPTRSLSKSSTTRKAPSQRKHLKTKSSNRRPKRREESKRSNSKSSNRRKHK